jgi:hypothetical protein
LERRELCEAARLDAQIVIDDIENHDVREREDRTAKVLTARALQQLLKVAKPSRQVLADVGSADRGVGEARGIVGEAAVLASHVADPANGDVNPTRRPRGKRQPEDEEQPEAAQRLRGKT